MSLGYTLTNSFLEKIYRKLKKLSKLFQFPLNFFFLQKWYYYVCLRHTLVKSFIELILQNSDNHVHACLGALGTLKTVVHAHSKHDNMLIIVSTLLK